MRNISQRHITRAHAGFSLMEIIAALAILGGAAFVLLNAHFTALRLHEITEDEINFRQLMEITVAKAEVGVFSGLLSDGGDFGARYPDYTWSYDAVEAGTDPMILLYAINASVQGPDEQRMLTFYVYDTGLGDQSEQDGQGGASPATRRTGNAGAGPATNQDASARRNTGRRNEGMFGGQGNTRSGRGGRNRRGGSSMFGN